MPSTRPLWHLQNYSRIIFCSTTLLCIRQKFSGHILGYFTRLSLKVPPTRRPTSHPHQPPVNYWPTVALIKCTTCFYSGLSDYVINYNKFLHVQTMEFYICMSASRPAVPAVHATCPFNAPTTAPTHWPHHRPGWSVGMAVGSVELWAIPYFTRHCTKTVHVTWPAGHCKHSSLPAATEVIL